jgi:hypothetical protein
MLEEAPGRVAFLTRSLARDPAKSVTELTNLQGIVEEYLMESGISRKVCTSARI